MKAFVLACLLAAVRANPLIASQYHVQDLVGGYAFGHAGGPSARQEVRSPDGVTRGAYSYVDANGIVQHATYVSDPVHGFRVSATNLPTAPVAHVASPLVLSPIAPLVAHPSVPADTPEVAAAKAAHAAAHAEALHRGKRSPAYYGPPAPLNPDGSVAPTPEFAAEAARLAAAHAQEHSRLSAAAALAAAHPDNTSPPGSYNSGPSYNPGPSYNQGPSYNAYNQGPSYNPAATQPAPLNPDGTVAETPEIRALKASHFAAHQQAQQRIAAYGPPSPYQGQHYGRKRRSAPLNPDGTVAPTPEVAAATAAHLAAHAGARVLPGSPLVLSPYSGLYSGLPILGYGSVHGRYYGPPAPLNIDGTVAHTPEYLAVAASHRAAHIHALRARRSAPLNPDGTVAPTPEVAAATAAHYAALNGAALRTAGHPVVASQWAPVAHGQVVRYTPPAPLNPDGTVAETPEVRALSAAHHAAHSQQLASLAAQESLAIASGPDNSGYYGPVAVHSGAPWNVQPAPLNPDGTVAHTPEYLAVAASHRAAHYG